MTEDEINLVASVAATTHGSWNTRQSYGQFMRYGRLFRPARSATGFFGIAFRPEYIQREYESHHDNDHPQGGFTHAIVGQQRFDPAADLIPDIGRDIPAWIREWAVSPQHPLSHSEAPAWVVDELRAFGDKSPQKRAEVHLRYSDRDPLYHSFAVLHRLDNGIRGAWLHPARIEDRRPVEDPPVLLTRNGVSYERALMAIVQAIGDTMPDEFAVDIPRFA